MRLDTLLAGLPANLDARARGTDVTDLTADSRRAGPGAAFVALGGAKSDGHAFAAAAVGQGAAAVLAEDPSRLPPLPVPVVGLPALKTDLAPIAHRFFGEPTRELALVGVTGTNGKTSTVYYAKSILAAAGMPAGLVGTIRYELGDEVLPAPNTTPDALELARLFRRMVDKGLKSCVMEVSSHALALGRVAGVAFDVAAFTNVTEDHLDFHGTMDAYLEAKLSFLDLLRGHGKGPRRVVVNQAIEYGDRVRAAVAASGLPAWTFGLEPGADFRAVDPVATLEETSFRLESPAGAADVSLSARGFFTIANALTAAACAAALGATAADCARGLAGVTIPGRFELVPNTKGFLVVVDYAHTDDALRNLLGAARRLEPNRVITVFGCGGDRDRGKRPLMARAAAARSDLVVVTSDNPRSEEPARIIEDILAGLADSDVERLVIEDRAAAIRAAVGAARPGDVVLIAGKGHEDYQIFRDRTIHFSDREEAALALGELA